MEHLFAGDSSSEERRSAAMKEVTVEGGVLVANFLTDSIMFSPEVR